ncbi:MAG: GDSL-type esterase/lipase family protein [Opitutaceae bacterium]|jgi:lysophospholipase L1-like esterase
MNRSLRYLALASALVFSTFAQIASAAGDFHLKNGDRVVFYGDSITDQRLYTTFAETFVVTRFPSLQVTFTHSGWGGDRVGGGHGGPIAQRLERDVFAYKPTVVTIMLGMNDGNYQAFNQGIFNTFSQGYTSIVEKLQTTVPGIRLTLIQPSPFDDVTRDPKFPGGYNTVLVGYGDFVKKLAEQNHQLSADFNTAVVSVLTKAKATDAELSAKIIPDRVHPDASGHLIMAGALLKAWNAPALVTEVEIDAAGKRVAVATATKVSALKAESSLSWTQLDEALPMPVNLADPATALAVKSSDFIETLDRQPLRVTGLTAPAYTLKIDDQVVGTWSKEDFAKGINLAVQRTPMTEQAAAVHSLTLQHTGLHQARWRNYQLGLNNPKSDAVKTALAQLLNALDAEEAAVISQQRDTAQPLARRYELTPQASVPAPVPAAAANVNPDAPLPGVTGLNLALNKTYVCSDPNVSQWDAGLTDGSWKAGRGTTFATGMQDTFPKTVTIDLTNPTSIAQVVAGVPAFGSTKTVAVSIGTDGQTFTEVGRYVFSLGKEEKHAFPFTPTEARYVRLTYLDHHDEKATFPVFYAFTSDVQVYGPSAK